MVARGENEDSSRARGELRSRVAEVARQVGISTTEVSKILTRALANSVANVLEKPFRRNLPA